MSNLTPEQIDLLEMVTPGLAYPSSLDASGRIFAMPEFRSATRVDVLSYLNEHWRPVPHSFTTPDVHGTKSLSGDGKLPPQPKLVPRR